MTTLMFDPDIGSDELTIMKLVNELSRSSGILMQHGLVVTDVSVQPIDGRIR